MIAATARSNHNVVQYMLSQKSGSGEKKTGEKTGESVSQSGIDRALVRAAAVIGRDGTNSGGGGE